MRLPVAPLVQFVGPIWSELPHGRGGRSNGYSHAVENDAAGALAVACGVNRKQAQRWLSDGLSVDVAERCAERLRCHPVEIWDDYYELADSTEIPSFVGWEPEPGGLFCGRPLEWRNTPMDHYRERGWLSRLIAEVDAA